VTRCGVLLPFTLAHPAASLPLRRPLGRFGVASALVIGSLVPDCGYFLPLPLSRGDLHTLRATVVYALPIGLVLYLVHHLLVAPALVPLLPTALARRVHGDDQEPWRLPPVPWSAVLVSLWLGALTHVLWDSFTHPGPTLRALPWLRTHLFWLGDTPVRLHSLLQQLGTVVGLGLLATWSLRWLRDARPDGSAASPRRRSLPAAERRRIRALLLAAAGLAALLSLGGALPEAWTWRGAQRILGAVVVDALSALCAAVLAWSLLARWRGLAAPVGSA